MKRKHIRMLLMTALLLSCTACGFFGKEETPTAPEKEAVKQEEKQKQETPVTDAATLRKQQIEKQAERMMQEMTTYEKLCQLLIVSPESLTGVGPVTAASDVSAQALAKMPVGGILYSRKNFISQEQVRTMLTNLQSYAKIPLILTCDEEGGRVNRLMDSVSTTYIGPMLNYKDQGSDVAYQNAFTIASDMKALGFNFDLAPVADVWSNPANTVIGDRAYSDDFHEAGVLVKAAVQGFHDGGVGTALKHFPGHGDTSADTHLGAVYVYKSLDELRGNELLPFQSGIEAVSDMVMIAHLILPDIDDQPAPFSSKIVTDLLRKELHFEGVVITDGLQMGAMSDYYSSGEIAVRAISAGVDLLLCPDNPQEAVSALQNALEQGELSQARIDESVKRILAMKINRGIIPLEQS